MSVCPTFVTTHRQTNFCLSVCRHTMYLSVCVSSHHLSVCVSERSEKSVSEASMPPAAGPENLVHYNFLVKQYQTLKDFVMCTCNQTTGMTLLLILGLFGILRFFGDIW